MSRSRPKPKVHEHPLKNPKHELFCWLYAGYHNRELFGNGTRCYMQAYGFNARKDELEQKISEVRKAHAKGYSVVIDDLEHQIKSMENGARTNAADLLAKTNIRARVDFLVDQYIGNDYSDRELQYVILQRHDFASKVMAIREYNRLKDRGNAGKLEGNFTFSWDTEEGAKPATPKQKQQPKVVKAVIKKTTSPVEWDE